MTDSTTGATGPATTRVTVLGTGTMGTGVARTLVREGFAVTVWNRTAERARPLGDDGATVAETAGEAVATADVVLSVLYDADSVAEVLDEVGDGLPEGAVWAQCSTIGVEGTERVRAIADAEGVTLLDAMMLGTKGPAEQGTLVLLVSGDPSVVDRVRPVFDAMGQRTVVAGDAIGDATRLKLVANTWIASITAATAQSVSLARALGVEPQLFLDAIEGGASDSPYAHVKGGAMLSGDLAPSFALDGLLKDVRLAADAASGTDFSPVLLDALEHAYATASRRGHGADDVAAVVHAF